MKSVSICMAVHNGAEFLADQMNSILPQLGKMDELVISDDNSSDESRSVVLSFQDSRIRLLNTMKFNNPVNNFEYALSQCRNNLIFLADQDDIWYPQKIRVLSEALEDHDLVVCDCRIVNKELVPLIPSFFHSNHSKGGLIANWIKSSFIGCCMAFHHNVLEKAIPFPPGIPMHDQWIGLVAEKYFKVKFIPEILVDHRIHGGNYSTTGMNSRNSLKNKITVRIDLAKKLLFEI